MKLVVETRIARFPKIISAHDALDFYLKQIGKHAALMVMAADWRVESEPGEEEWFEEIGAEEFEDEDFLETFATARLELWIR